MKKIVLDKWCTSQNEIVKHYCRICGRCIDEEEIQNSEEEQYFCLKHKGLSSPNVLLIDERLFKAVFKTIGGIFQKYNVNGLTFHVGRDGVQFQYIDPSNVSVTKLHLYVKAFKVLKIDFPSPRTFTINLDELRKIMEKLERNDEVLIKLNENDIQISLLEKNYNYSKTTQEKSFSLKLLNTPVEDISEPELKFQVLISIKVNALIQVLKKIKKLANYENTYFECTPNSFQIYAYDNNNNKISETFSESELLKMCVENEVSNVYNADYILTIIDGLKQYINIIQMQYSNNMPILLTANLSSSVRPEDYHSYLGYIKFYLAPRILDV